MIALSFELVSLDADRIVDEIGCSVLLITQGLTWVYFMDYLRRSRWL